MVTGKLIYLASPYTHKDPAVRQRRFEIVCCWAAILKRAGCFVFSPIVHAHPIVLAHGVPVGWDYWKVFDRMMVERSQAVLIAEIDGWQESVGVTEEHSIARELGLPVGFLAEPENEELVTHYVRSAGLVGIDMTGITCGDSSTYISRGRHEHS